MNPGPPSKQPSSHPAFSFSLFHRGWTSGPDVFGESVGLECSQSWAEEPASWQSLYWLGKRVCGLECWVGGEAQTPTQKVLLLLFKGRDAQPGMGRANRHSLQTPRLRLGLIPRRPAFVKGIRRGPWPMHFSYLGLCS